MVSDTQEFEQTSPLGYHKRIKKSMFHNDSRGLQESLLISQEMCSP